jgi:hypothetical protein
VNIKYLISAVIGASILGVSPVDANRAGELGFSFADIPPTPYSSRYREWNPSFPQPKPSQGAPSQQPGQQAGQRAGQAANSSVYDQSKMETSDKQWDESSSVNRESGADFMRYGPEPGQVTGAPGQSAAGPSGTVNFYGTGGKPVFLDNAFGKH